MAKRKKGEQSEDDELARLLKSADDLPDLEAMARDMDVQMDKLMEQASQEDESIKKILAEMADQEKRLLESLAESQTLEDLSNIFDGVKRFEGEPFPPPDPNLTFADAAQWMKQQIETSGTLDHSRVVHHLDRHFGERFTRLNDNGNLVVAREVLEAFERLTRGNVVWSRSELSWRKRRSDDPPGRLVE